ncbi:MAG: methyltransferase domain-containing protein [Candidatus Bathyarchaeia archaeon]
MGSIGYQSSTASFEAFKKKRPSLPFVPSPPEVVRKMLELALPAKEEILMDLGCGDGRILLSAARDYGCNAFGIEKNRALVELARRRASLAKPGSVKVLWGDLFEADLSKAQVLTLYLTPESLRLLKPRLERNLSFGARVVSHDYRIRGWNPLRVEEVFSYTDGRIHRIYLYRHPAFRRFGSEK